MMKTPIRWALAFSCLAVMPLSGQSTSTTATAANTTMATNPAASAATHSMKKKTTTVSSTATTTVSTSTVAGTPVVGSSGTMGGAAPAVEGSMGTAASMQTTKSVTHTHHSHKVLSGSMKQRVLADSTRIASILTDVQSSAAISAEAWGRIANEANALANRVYGSTAGNATARAAASDLRRHIREMRSAAASGDAAAAKSHAGMALPFATKLIDWASPKAS